MDQALQAAIEEMASEVVAEAKRAINGHGRFASLHEAYGVLVEEVREFEAEVFRKSNRRDLVAVRAELMQVAAVAIKAAVCFTGATAVQSSKLMSERTLPAAAGVNP